jgi:hypothetical protein
VAVVVVGLRLASALVVTGVTVVNRAQLQVQTQQVLAQAVVVAVVLAVSAQQVTAATVLAALLRLLDSLREISARQSRPIWCGF